MIKVVLVLLVLTSALSAQDGKWLPANGRMSHPRVLISQKDSADIVQLLRHDTLRRGVFAGVAASAFSPTPSGNTASAERRARASLAKNIAFVLYVQSTVQDTQLVALSQQERTQLVSTLRELLRSINTDVEQITLSNPSAYNEWQWRTKELIDYCAAFDIYSALMPQSADSIHTPLRLFASNLYTESTRSVLGLRFFDIVKNNHALMTAGALGVAAVTLGEFGSNNENEQPARWMGTALYVLNNVMWTDSSAQSKRGILAGYAEGPYYFRYAMLNCFPMFRAVYNVLPDTVFTAAYQTSTAQVRHPYYDKDYTLLYQWIHTIQLPNRCLPPIGDTYINTAFPEVHLVGEYVYSPTIAWISSQLQSTVDMRANYLSVPNSKQGQSPISNIEALKDAGSVVIRPYMDDTYVHVVAKNGKARTSGAGHSQSDAASFMLYSRGETLALDPGYISYARRNEVGNAEQHNSILVDGSGPPNGAPLAAGGSDTYITTLLTDNETNTGFANVQTTYNGATISRTFFMLDSSRIGIADVMKSTTPHTYTWQLHGNGIIGGAVPNGNATVSLDTNKAIGVWTMNKAKLHAQVSGTQFTNARVERSAHEIAYNDTAQHTVLRCDTRKAVNGSFGAILTPTTTGSTVPLFDVYNGEKHTSFSNESNAKNWQIFFVNNDTTFKSFIYSPINSGLFLRTDAESGYVTVTDDISKAWLCHTKFGDIPNVIRYSADKDVSMIISATNEGIGGISGVVDRACTISFGPVFATIPESSVIPDNIAGSSVESWFGSIIKFNGAGAFRFGWRTTSVEEDHDAVAITPNPVHDVLHIVAEEKEIQEVVFHTVLGEVALRAQCDNSSRAMVSVQSLPAGVYTIRITTRTGILFKKVIVEH